MPRCWNVCGIYIKHRSFVIYDIINLKAFMGSLQFDLWVIKRLIALQYFEAVLKFIRIASIVEVFFSWRALCSFRLYYALFCHHNSDVIMNAVASQIIGVSIVCSTVYSGTSKLRVTGLCKGNPPVTGGSPHRGPVTRKMFTFDDVIMIAFPWQACWYFMQAMGLSLF